MVLTPKMPSNRKAVNGPERFARVFTPAIIFVSSDTNEYRSPRDSRDELLPQFAGAGIQ